MVVFLIIYLLFRPFDALAQSEEPQSSGSSDPILSWMEGLHPTKIQAITDGHRVAMVQGYKKGKLLLFEADTSRLNGTGLLTFFDAFDWSALKKFNRDYSFGKRPTKQQLHRWTGSKFIVQCIKETCSLSEDFLGKIRSNHLTEKVKVAGSTKDYIDLWRQLLGYDGVVLDHVHGQILIWTLLPIDPMLKFGIAFIGSHKQTILSKKQDQKTLPMKLRTVKGSMGIYEPLSQGKEAVRLPLGTKIRIDTGG
jgi:hypothetical protein